MDYDTDSLFPRDKTGRDSNVRTMYDKGKVIERCVDETQVSVRVQILDKDGFITKPIPVKQRGSRSNQDFWCPDIGDDVSVCFPPNAENGDGHVDGSFYNTGNPPPKAVDPYGRVLVDQYGKATGQVVHPDTTHKTFRDGSVIQFNPIDSTFTFNSKGPMYVVTIGKITIVASDIDIIAKVKITGDVSIVGDVDVQGNITNSGDMQTGGVHTDSIGHHV